MGPIMDLLLVVIAVVLAAGLFRFRRARSAR
jgi:hypothetical protein